jgi:MFS superfamily sulfate permease-like transporter
MLYFAVSAIEKIRHLPKKNLVNLGLAALLVLVVIVLFKVAARMNKFVLGIIILVTLMVLMLTWVHERNEPKFLSPIIDAIAPYVPNPRWGK